MKTCGYAAYCSAMVQFVVGLQIRVGRFDSGTRLQQNQRLSVSQKVLDTS